MKTLCTLLLTLLLLSLLTTPGFSQEPNLGVDYSILESISETVQTRHVLRVRVHNGGISELSQATLGLADPENGLTIGAVSELGTLPAEAVWEGFLEVVSETETLDQSLLFNLSFLSGNETVELLIQGIPLDEGGQQ